MKHRSPLLRSLAALGLGGAGMAAWALSRQRHRRPGTPMPADTAIWGGPAAAADLGQFVPGAAPVQAQPWDIGTGVAGYVWHAPGARAALLLQHGYAEYSYRYLHHYHQF